MQRTRRIIVLCIALLVVGGLVVFFMMRNRTVTPLPVVQQQNIPVQGVKEVRQPPVPTAWDKGPATDRDADGIPDEEEKRLGTNPFDKDTDHDGSADSEEIMNKTNPNDPASVQLQDFSLPQQ